MKIKTETDIRENTLISKTKYVFFPCVHFCVAYQSDKWLCYMKNDGKPNSLMEQNPCNIFSEGSNNLIRLFSFAKGFF